MYSKVTMMKIDALRIQSFTKMDVGIRDQRLYSEKWSYMAKYEFKASIFTFKSQRIQVHF